MWWWVGKLSSSLANESHFSLPQGFDANHPDIELLRLRNYTIGRKLTESEVTAPGGLETIAGLLTALKPFVSRVFFPLLFFITLLPHVQFPSLSHTCLAWIRSPVQNRVDRTMVTL